MTRYTLVVLSLFVFSGCAAPPMQNTANVAPQASPSSAPATTQTTPATSSQADVVKASVSETQLRAGGAGEASVRLLIAEGYHVNANPPSDKFYIGTQLTVTAADGIEPGKPLYPPALSRKLGFSAKPLAVYEKEAVIKLPLRATAAAQKGRHELPAKIRVQPCNDQACLQPRDIQVTIPATIN